MDSQNFNAYILQKLGCSPAECERRIKGKNVPIMVIHALVQLRESYNTVSKSRPAIKSFENTLKDYLISIVLQAKIIFFSR